MRRQKILTQRAKTEVQKVQGARSEDKGVFFGVRCFPVSVFRIPAAWTVLLLLALIGVAPAQVVGPEVRKVSERFVCQCGCNEQLSVCAMLNCGSATPLRAEIAELLKQGKTEKEIVDIFVSKYGKVILAAPTTQGFDLTAWTLPFVMLFLGLVLVYFLIKAWAKRRALPLLESNTRTEIPEDYQVRIERELKDLDS
jgi:cytochrome c-type biogenesis protein CcmH